MIEFSQAMLNETMTSFLYSAGPDVCQMAAQQCAEVVIATNNAGRAAMYSIFANLFLAGVVCYLLLKGKLNKVQEVLQDEGTG